MKHLRSRQGGGGKRLGDMAKVVLVCDKFSTYCVSYGHERTACDGKRRDGFHELLQLSNCKCYCRFCTKYHSRMLKLMICIPFLTSYNCCYGCYYVENRVYSLNFTLIKILFLKYSLPLGIRCVDLVPFLRKLAFSPYFSMQFHLKY